MDHRHLVAHEEYSYAKIDDILDRGGETDWIELRNVVERDRQTAERVLSLSRATERYGTSNLWIRFVEALYPELRQREMNS
jgi:hypothetical protein